MPPDRLSSGFDAIRPWRGSTDRAFEELCYQLFKSDAPADARVARTGNPDGGVEWYATLPNGEEHGWQAKHAHDIDSLLGGMTESVKSVVADRPRLTKLTFLISSNLGAATSGGKRKSQRQKYEDKVASWKGSITGADKIAFDLVQESDILDRLALPDHAGRKWFWWGDYEFTPAWLTEKLNAQIDIAGEKYRPDLQVDLPIEDDLAALGFDAKAVEHLDALRRAVVAEARRVRLTKTGSAELVAAYDRVTDALSALRTTATELHVEPATVAEELATLDEALQTLDSAISAAADLEYAAEAAWAEAHPDQDRYVVRDNAPYETRGYKISTLVDRTAELRRWLRSTAGRAFREGLYFLEGEAGSGKTHLLLGSTQRALAVDRPAVFLNAARFGYGDLWASICDQLGLALVGADVLLGAMDAAGEASGLIGRRFVIAIDALNDTVDTNFWQVQLPALRAAVGRWPHVALVVSCRDTYTPVVCDAAEKGKYVNRSHPGFAGHEVEAMHKYFAFHGLEEPRIPLLVPEFSVPLFLKLYCEGLRDTGDTAHRGHVGLVSVFQRYLNAKIDRVARRFRPTAATAYELAAATREVTTVVNALLDEFAATGREGVTLTRGEELVAGALGTVPTDTAVVLGAMQSEGILNQELLYIVDGGNEQGLRIVFQALADYMILRRRLDRAPDVATDDAVRRWLRSECSFGILEAATVTMPELYGVELPDLLGIDITKLHKPDFQDREASRRYQRDVHIAESVVTSLPYREASAVTDRTVDLLNASLSFLRDETLFDVMFAIAPQPNNQLNGNRLHEHLCRFRMPKRDAYFGFATYYALSDESGAAARLARWASKGPYPAYDPDVIELAAIPLVWLLSSPNRFMRDWVTRALVTLLRGHLAVAERLLVRFWSIDDPYVVQRVLVIVYGAVMRADDSQAGAARSLVLRVKKLVFTQPTRADEILLDAARGIVAWGTTKGIVPKSHLRVTRRRYNLRPPGPAPSEETLEAKYGWKEDQPDAERYFSILASVLSLGDFGRYVVESGIDTFSRHSLDKPYPPEPDEERTRIIEPRWTRFVASLSDAQRSQLAALAAARIEDVTQLDAIRSGFMSTLSDVQKKMFKASFRAPRRRAFRDDLYPADRAKRWIVARVFRLGWTPQLFGETDRRIGYSSSGREAHKAERWGKKYQWIAYHELLARVADNYHASRRFSDHREYEGLHQIIADRELDPSFPPVPFSQFLEPETGNDTWRPSPITLSEWPPAPVDVSQYQGSLSRFIEDAASEPTLERVALLSDSTGDPWVVLDANIGQGGDSRSEEPWLGLQQAFYLHTWLSPKSDAGQLLSRLPHIVGSERHELFDDHGHVDCCYFGEIGWTPHHCYNQHADFTTAASEGDPSIHVAHTVEHFTWESGLYDCSINEGVRATLPSTFIQSRARLVADERGPSWFEEGRSIFTNYGDEGHHTQRGFLVRGDWLAGFLKAHDLELLVAASTLRLRITKNYRHGRDRDPELDDRLDVFAAARIDADLNVEMATSVRLLNRYETGEPGANEDRATLASKVQEFGYATTEDG
ncbi:MAG TPA: ATP-binding protein [Frankiaceae bacterium]|jgi:hypothetical protein|nr:ATP-binding protein [Frankiaceae bacterium]